MNQEYKETVFSKMQTKERLFQLPHKLDSVPGKQKETPTSLLTLLHYVNLKSNVPLWKIVHVHNLVKPLQDYSLSN